MTDKEKAAELLAFIDMSRKEIERAMKAENFYSAAHLADQLSIEALALSEITSREARNRTKGEAA